jgi:hypothetical protein
MEFFEWGNHLPPDRSADDMTSGTERAFSVKIVKLFDRNVFE